MYSLIQELYTASGEEYSPKGFKKLLPRNDFYLCCGAMSGSDLSDFSFVRVSMNFGNHPNIGHQNNVKGIIRSMVCLRPNTFLYEGTGRELHLAVILE